MCGYDWKLLGRFALRQAQSLSLILPLNHLDYEL